MAEILHAVPPSSGGTTPRNRRQKFISLAESRTVKAIKAIRVLGNLSNKASYEYDEADVKKIICALHVEVDALKNRLLSSDKKKSVEFKL